MRHCFLAGAVVGADSARTYLILHGGIVKFLRSAILFVSLLALAACGSRNVSSMDTPGSKTGWVGDEEAMLSDIYSVSVPYGTVVPIRQPMRGFIVQSRPFPEGFRTYTLVVTILPTQTKAETGESARAYALNIACENSDVISSGVENEVYQKIVSVFDAKYKKVHVQ